MSVKLRSQQIIIDTPREGQAPWMHVVVQEVEKDADGKVLNVIQRHEYLHKTGEEIAMDVYEYFDPILGTANQISGYGLQMAVASAVISWMQSIEGGYINEEGDLIIKDD